MTAEYRRAQEKYQQALELARTARHHVPEIVAEIGLEPAADLLNEITAALDEARRELETQHETSIQGAHRP